MKRQWFFVLHSWAGVTCGLLLFLVSWSGTVAVFAHEIDWLLNPALRAPVAAQPVSWQTLAEGAQDASPGATLSMLRAPYAPGWAAEAWIEARSGQLQRVYLDPGTGRATGTTSFFNVERFFRDFHMRLMWPDTGQWGYYVVAAMSLVVLAQVVAGLVFYRRWWTRLFTLRLNRGRPALLTDLHRLAGIWSLLFTPIIVVTGVWYLVERVDATHIHALPSAPRAAQVSIGERDMRLDRLVVLAKAAQPHLRITAIYFPSDMSDPIAFIGQDGAFVVRDAAARVELSPFTGQVAASQTPDSLGAVRRWAETADRIHFGDFGGLASKTAWFIFGLMLSGLSLTGAYLHVMRSQGTHGLARGPAVIAAHVVTLALLVLTVYGGWNEIRDYGTRDAWPIVPIPVTVFLVAWVASTVAVLQWWVRKVS